LENRIAGRTHYDEMGTNRNRARVPRLCAGSYFTGFPWVLSGFGRVLSGVPLPRSRFCTVLSGVPPPRECHGTVKAGHPEVRARFAGWNARAALFPAYPVFRPCGQPPRGHPVHPANPGNPVSISWNGIDRMGRIFGFHPAAALRLTAWKKAMAFSAWHSGL
jgi:hypothetical protein